MKKITISALFLSVCCAIALPGQAQSTVSEASGASVLVTGSLVVAASTLPIVAAVSIMDAVVRSVRSHRGATEIQIRQDKSGQTATIRIPTNALQGKRVSVGMRSTLVADPTGHTLEIDNAPIAYLPGPAAAGLVHSKTVK